MSNRSVIPWYRYGAGATEDLIAALLMDVHPTAERVNGAGGDDGADVVLPVEGGIHVFEIKSFHQSLSASQRRQVVDSLKTAVKKRPDMLFWTLVMPRDLTPGEVRWIDTTVRPLTQVVVAWHGRTWLEAKLAERPALQRMFAPGSPEDIALEHLAKYKEEIAGLAGGAPDLVKRITNLQSLSDAIDSDYAFDTTTGPQGIEIVLRPKRPNVPPLDLTSILSAASEAGYSEAVAKFQTYGTPLRATGVSAQGLVLPGRVAELMDPAGTLDVSLGPAPEDAAWQQTGRLFAVQGTKTLASLAVVYEKRTKGQLGGGFFAAQDQAGLLTLGFAVQPDMSGQVQFTMSPTRDHMPAEMRPALRFVNALLTADGIRIESPAWPATRINVNPDKVDFTAAQNLINFVEALDRVQVACGIEFAVPPKWTLAEARTVEFCDHLLRFGHAAWPWPFAYVPLTAQVIRDQILAFGPFPRLSMSGHSEDAPRPLEIFDQQIILPGQVRFDAREITVANTPELAKYVSSVRPERVILVHLRTDDRSSWEFTLDLHGKT